MPSATTRPSPRPDQPRPSARPTDAVERYGDEARALRGPRRAQAIRDDLVAELERASRALGMVEHGANIWPRHGAAAASSRPRPSIKRGYLNLIHAREAIARHAIAGGPDCGVDEPPAGSGPRFGA